jgi:hypothetical protein
MQIRTVVLYSPEGKTQQWTFELGKPNIITGARRTGKTALLRIVEYCMGRGECDIPKGVIRNSVEWYAVLFDFGGTQAFVARRNPPKGAETSSEIYLEVGTNLEIPAYSALRKVIDIDGLVATLGDLLAIRENLNIPGAASDRAPLEANLKHTWFYLFQRQDEVAAPAFIFHREKENSFMQQAIKDTLPYFLGVVRDDRFRKQQELRRVQKEMRRLSRRIQEMELVKGEALSRGKALVAEAQELGMSDLTTIPEEQTALISVLESLRRWKPTDLSRVPGLALESLQEERSELLRAYRERSEALDSLMSFASAQGEYIDETSEQRVRLESVGLLRKKDFVAHCPLCDSEIDSREALTSELIRATEEMSAQLESASRERARLGNTISIRTDELADLRQRIRDKADQVTAALDQNAAAIAHRDLDNRRAKVAGRVSLYLESLAAESEDENLRKMLAEYQSFRDTLQDELSDDTFEIELTSRLNAVSNKMSSWTDRLDTEYRGDLHWFDLNHLTVVAQTPSGAITMGKMGGGTNVLSCHLLAFFGLHNWFATKERPVPRFLMLDQISQVYYPADLQSEPSEDDRIAVREMYEWLFERVRELEGKFQLIITDHADIDQPWFRNAVVDRWRSGKKMVPPDWIKVPEMD